MKKLLFGLFFTLSFGLSAQDNYRDSLLKYRENYKHDFLVLMESPLDSAGVEKITFFEPDKKWVVEAAFFKSSRQKPFEMATYNGGTAEYIKYGMIAFQIDGKDYNLSVYQSLRLLTMPSFKDYLFLPFRDLTCEDESYGGGRYLELHTGDIQNGKVVIDFNKCYNPYCAYSEGYACPVPPIENNIKVRILAGEKRYLNH